ncbi:MAG: hypothetical protein ACFFCS_17865 [Candidatus Hodarchaeota archaeon]
MEWYDYIIDAFNDFTDYFQAQALPVQILLLVIVVCALVGVGFLIYGILWCVYQVVKAAIVGTIIVVYLTGIGITVLVMLIAAQDQIEPTWKRAVHNIKWFANRAWPPKEGSNRVQPILQQVVVPETIPKTVIQTREVPKALEERTYFCTHCGTPFTGKMNGLLKSAQTCYCEACGTRFNATDGAPAAVF